MTEMPDWPAAHSMDTTWWGLDRQGRLARFDTGEAGAVPADAQGDAGQIDLIRDLGELFPFSCDDLFPAADGRLLRQPLPWEDEQSDGPVDVDPSREPYLPSFLLWLVDEDALAQVVASTSDSEIVRLKAPGKVVIWLSPEGEGEGEPQALLTQVLAWKDQGLLQRGWLYEFGSVEIERLGLIHYHLRTFDNWICGPYTRGPMPASALRLQDLPRKVQEGLGVCELPLADFERDVLLQPYEHGEAASWDDQWVSTTGEVRVGELDEEGPEQLPGLTVPPARAASRKVGLVAAYLRGEEGTAEVLGDWLEEQGQERIPVGGTVSGRLDEVLMRWFRPEQRAALEVEFLEHALAHEPVPPELAQRLAALIQAVRGADPEARAAAAREAFEAWMPEDGQEEEEAPPEANRLAWAAWAVGSELPLVCAQTLRAVSPAQLRHQVERVLAELRD
jgi:hypothetical protein